MQAIVELSLKRPLKLRMVEVPRMKFEIVGVHRDIRVLEIDDDLDSIVFVACGEIQQWMFV